MPRKMKPFPFDYHGTPTPSPVPVADATPGKIITHKYDIISKGETIKIAEWGRQYPQDAEFPGRLRDYLRV